jgi:hypothetical protein
MNDEEIFEVLEEEHINSQITDIGLEIMMERVRVATELIISVPTLSDKVISEVSQLGIQNIEAIRRG